MTVVKTRVSLFLGGFALGIGVESEALTTGMIIFATYALIRAQVQRRHEFDHWGETASLTLGAIAGRTTAFFLKKPSFQQNTHRAFSDQAQVSQPYQP